METRKTLAQKLNYFQQSPVRGQLEPPDGTTGDRRFLQCTDIPNELKVLLPSRTSVLYGNLLKIELDELKKGSHANWERIREIRHLKERMLRKCERLARGSMPERPAGQILTLYAPPEFRLREMERWLKHHAESTSEAPAGYS
ncbi:hypothetical protein NM688_g4608 [Phlebia brevispora]|uniref:Uncharacterized protein n=1 Tax=Phlebia brevispora TaxID=194682 RepID=A0ACC1T2F9_9APHY|nr:hypothetical protein NM688_g4608 [Phlebia brevispora]